MLQEFVKQIKMSVTEQLNGIHTAIPGKIVKFNADKCEAEIIPLGKLKKPNGQFMDYPKLTEVPVMFPRFAKGGVFFPVSEGDGCLLLFSEYTLDTFRNLTESSNDFKFDLTNAVAIVGLYREASPLVASAQKDNAVIIGNGENIIKIGEDKIELLGNVIINGKSFSSHTHNYSWTETSGNGTTSAPN